MMSGVAIPANILGADEFLSKPFTPAALEDILNSLQREYSACGL